MAYAPSSKEAESTDASPCAIPALFSSISFIQTHSHHNIIISTTDTPQPKHKAHISAIVAGGQQARTCTSSSSQQQEEGQEPSLPAQETAAAAVAPQQQPPPELCVARTEAEGEAGETTTTTPTPTHTHTHTHQEETKEDEEMGRPYDQKEPSSDIQYQSFKDAVTHPQDNDDYSTGSIGTYSSSPTASFCVKRPICGTWGGPRTWTIRRRTDRCGVALLSLAVILAVMGAFAPLIVGRLVDYGIDQQTILNSNGKGKAYSNFVQSGENMGVKIYYSLSYLNLTNPDAVLAGKAKPQLQEVGPYIYREHRRKLNVTFAPDGETVSFVLRKYYVWDEEANAATGKGLRDTEDLITTVHPVIQVLQAQLRTTLNAQLKDLLSPTISWLGPLKRAIDREIDSSSLWKTSLKLVLCQGNPMGVSPFTTQTPRDLFWGYHNDSVLLTMQALVDDITKLAKRVGKKIDLPVVPEAFPGLQPNLTTEEETARRVGPNVVYTGQGHSKAKLMDYVQFQNMTQVHACPDPTTGKEPAEGEMPACDVYQGEWNNRTAARHGYQPQWGSAVANQVRGTDGSMFAHPLTHTPYIYTFQEDYRRWVQMVFAGEVDDFQGMTLRRYVFTQEDFRNDSVWAADFFQENLPTGLTNLSLMGGFPLFLSKPHFLEADVSVAGAVEGLAPEVEKHLTFIDAEERSGVTFRSRKRVQLNVGVSKLVFPSLARFTVDAFVKLFLGVRMSEREEKCMAQKVTWAFPEEHGEGTPGLFFPVVWYDEGYEMPASFVHDFKSQVYGSVSGAKTAQVAGPLLALVLGLVGVVVMVWGRKKEKERARTRTNRWSTQEDILV